MIYSLGCPVKALRQFHKDTQIGTSVFPMSILKREREKTLKVVPNGQTRWTDRQTDRQTGWLSHRVDFEFPDGAAHLKWLAVYLLSCLLQLPEGVDLEHTSLVAGNHLTVRERGIPYCTTSLTTIPT